MYVFICCGQRFTLWLLLLMARDLLHLLINFSVYFMDHSRGLISRFVHLFPVMSCKVCLTHLTVAFKPVSVSKLGLPPGLVLRRERLSIVFWYYFSLTNISYCLGDHPLAAEIPVSMQNKS